jgi:hypothetical protein
VNSSGKRPARPGGGARRTRCGGWATYRDWAAHDFRARPLSDDGLRAGDGNPAGPAFTELRPVTVPDEEVPSSGGGGKNKPELAAPERKPAVTDAAKLVRPYVRVRGRVDAGHALEFESVLTATGLHENSAPEGAFSEEQLALCANCAQPRSVAEIAAAMTVPIGVAKVLISDAIDVGLLVLHERTAYSDGRLPLELLKRVHAGIANLA